MSAADDKPKETGEEFLSRWSRRKQEVRAEALAPRSAKSDLAKTPAPELPPVDKLDMNSDYSGFFHPKVDETLRRAALKKLFSDPHFNVMDGLDIYIDDYSISDPLPAAMLEQMKSAQNILAWSRETEVEAEQRRNPPPADSAVPVVADGEAAALPGADAAALDSSLPAAEDAAAPAPAWPVTDNSKQNT